MRVEDCNLCYDRLCESCTNFDEDAECTACIANAGDSGLSPCECNGDLFFHEDTDMCENCHVYCQTCEDYADTTNKFCDTCSTDHYKQRGSPTVNTCLPFCPTGESPNSETKA